MSVLDTLQAKKAPAGPAKPERKQLGGYFNSYEEGKAAVEACAKTLVGKYGQAIVKLIGPNDEAGNHIGVGIKTRTESTNIQMWRSGRVFVTDMNVFSRIDGFNLLELPGIVWEVEPVAETSAK